MTISELWHQGWTAPLLNHLWQSTVVLLVAWLATVALRRNPARVRYAVWMLSSVKFLVPFALLADLGERWATPTPGKSVASAVYTTIEEIGQPFPQPISPAGHAAAVASPAQWIGFVPAVLAGLWLCGFIAVLVRWCVRWRQMARLAADSVPVYAGREVEALRRAETNAELQQAISLRTSPRAIEPGVFGILHPVLLWPAGISAHLDDAQVDSIMAHEVEHVRRRDNLTSAVHMLVEALFWFYPALHWTGSRLMEERERACDEKVLEMSARPETYAESILKVCAFCLEPPAPCVAGVSGSDLKTRVLRIMTHPPEVRLGALRKCLLGAAATTIVAFPIGFGMLHALQAPAQLIHASSGPVPGFEVATIKPSDESGMQMYIQFAPTGFAGKHLTLNDLVKFAYGIRSDDQLVGMPSWARSTYFDVQAKESDADIEAAKSLGILERRDKLALMLQSLLAERFALKGTFETRELSVYALVVAKGGAKLKEVQPDPFPPPGVQPSPTAHLPRLSSMDDGRVTATAFRMDEFSNWLSRFDEVGNRVVMNETGLTGSYDFVITGLQRRSKSPAASQETTEEPSTSIFTALQEQLGLKLEPRKAPVEVLVVEHAEPPSPN